LIAAGSAGDLAGGHHSRATATGIALTAVAVAVMPLLGQAKHRLAARLGSAATADEGTQNYLCAAQAAAVFAGLAVTAAWPSVWWADPVVGLAIAAAAAWQGIRSWRGDDCCLPSASLRRASLLRRGRARFSAAGVSGGLDAAPAPSVGQVRAVSRVTPRAGPATALRTGRAGDGAAAASCLPGVGRQGPDRP
jgi:hypothetical protein